MSGEPRLPESVRTIPAALAFWAEQTPDAPALIVPGKPPLTYADLWREASDLATSLRRRGVARQDRVVVLVPEGPALAVVLLGTMCAAIAVPLADTLPAPELDAALAGLQANGAIVAHSLPAARLMALSRAEVPVWRLSGDGSAALAAENPSRKWLSDTADARPDDIALVIQTSGTTGRPKRVPRAHGWVISSGRTHRETYGLGSTDRAVTATPLTLSLGCWTLFFVIASGGALIFPETPSASHVWAAITEERATWMQVAAGWLEVLARFLSDRPALPPPSSLRFVRVTSAAISPAVCNEVAIRLAVPILPSYTLSEVGRIAMIRPPPAPSRPGSVGQLAQEVRFVDEHGTDVPPGTTGEIWVRRTEDFLDYLGDPELNAAVFTPDGWFRTGDAGYLDDQGFLFLTGRLNELINRGGAKIAPAEVDAVLLAHPAVREAATFAVPDGRLGEDIVAAVVLEPGQTPTPRQLRRWMLDRLGPHKPPRRIWFVTAADLPRTSSGKVRRGVLTERFLNRRDQDA